MRRCSARLGLGGGSAGAGMAELIDLSLAMIRHLVPDASRRVAGPGPLS
jgi:hypothetical protein